MCMCDKCMKICGAVFLALGVIYLVVDLQLAGSWDFWGISWYTAVFIAAGVGGLASSGCPDCKAAKTGGMAKKK